MSGRWNVVNDLLLGALILFVLWAILRWSLDDAKRRQVMSRKRAELQRHIVPLRTSWAMTKNWTVLSSAWSRLPMSQARLRICTARHRGDRTQPVARDDRCNRLDHRPLDFGKCRKKTTTLCGVEPAVAVRRRGTERT
jgi:hypothetical protein